MPPPDAAFVPIDPSIVDQNAPQDTAPAPAPSKGIGETLLDINNAAGAGIKGAINQTDKFIAKVSDAIGSPLAAGANMVSNAFGGGDIATSDAQGMVQRNLVLDDSYDPATVAGHLTKPTAQFITGLIGAGKFMGAAKGFQELGSVAQGFISGAAADAVAFDPSQDRLSNLFNEYADAHPALRNPITDYLASNEGDSDASGRLKNALEGVLGGAVVERAFAGIQGLRKVWKAKERGGDLAGAQELAKVADELEAAGHGATAEAKVGFGEGEVGGGVREGDPVPAIPDKPTPELLLPQDPNLKVLDAQNAAVKKLDQPLLDDAEIRSITNQIKDNPDWLVQGEVRPNQNYNYANLDTEDGAKLALDAVANQMEPIFKTSGRQFKSLESIKDLASTFSGEPERLLVDLQALHKSTSKIEATLVAGRSLVTGLAKRAADLARQVERDPGLMPELQKLLQQTANVDNLVRGVRSNTARATTAGRIRVAAELTPAEIKALQTVGGNPEAFMKIVQKPPAWTRALGVHNEFWINGLLSGARTHIRNMVSNTIQTVLLPAERMLGGAVLFNKDSIRQGASTYMGLRYALKDSMSLAVKASGLPDIADAALKGDASGALKAAKETGTSILDKGNAKVDGAQRAISTGNFTSLAGTRMGTALDTFGEFVRLPNRFLTSEDEFFKQLNYRAKVSSDAVEEALSKGLKGADIGKYIADRMVEAFDGNGAATNIAAMEYARRATFTAKAEPGSFIGGLETLANKHPAMKLVLPFIRTPTNILKEAGLRTPLLNMLSKKYREALSGSLGMPAKADAWGKMATGGVLWGSSIALALEGKITGRGPADPRERQVLMTTGWQPYSFKTQSGYVSFDGFDPMSTFFGLAGDFSDGYHHMDDATQKNVVGSMAIAMAQNLTSKSYLTGLTQVMDALTQPDKKMDSFIKSRAASYVPAGFKQQVGLIPSMQDPYLRETRTVMDAVLNKLPGFSQSLPPKRNIFGDAVTARGAIGPDSISPFWYSEQKDDHVANELSRFSHAFSAPAEHIGTIDLTQFKSAKGQDFYDRWQEQLPTMRVGRYNLKERLDHLISSNSYAGWRKNEADALELGAEPKTLKEVRKVIEEYRQVALQKTMKEYPEVGAMIRAEKQTQRRASAGAQIPDALKALLQPQ